MAAVVTLSLAPTSLPTTGSPIETIINSIPTSLGTGTPGGAAITPSPVSLEASDCQGCLMNAACTYYTGRFMATGRSGDVNRTTSVPDGEAWILLDSYQISTKVFNSPTCSTLLGPAATLPASYTYTASSRLNDYDLSQAVASEVGTYLGFPNCFVNAQIVTPAGTAAQRTDASSIDSRSLSETTRTTAPNPPRTLTSLTVVPTNNNMPPRSKDGNDSIKIAATVAASVFGIIVIALGTLFVLKRRKQARLSKIGSTAESRRKSHHFSWHRPKTELDAEQYRHEMQTEKDIRELQGQSSRREMEAEQEPSELEGQSRRQEMGGDQANSDLARTRNSQELKGVEPNYD